MEYLGYRIGVTPDMTLDAVIFTPTHQPNVLPGLRTLGLEARNEVQLVEVLAGGLPPETAERLARHLALSLTGGMGCAKARQSVEESIGEGKEKGIDGLAGIVFSEGFFGFRQGKPWVEAEGLRAVAEVYQGLKKLLAERGLSGGIGDEGGFAPDLESNGAALALIAEAVERSGYALGDQIGFALDPAARARPSGPLRGIAVGVKDIMDTAVVLQLREALKGASTLYLATDEDREGEAIAWHLR